MRFPLFARFLKVIRLRISALDGESRIGRRRHGRAIISRVVHLSFQLNPLGRSAVGSAGCV